MRAARFSGIALWATLRARLEAGAELALALDPPINAESSSSAPALRLRPMTILWIKGVQQTEATCHPSSPPHKLPLEKHYVTIR